jgi:radical SAM superfamily enzyme YgiQ (UPF0313 family)
VKILLIWPKVRGDWFAVAEPLALEYVAAGARLDGHEVLIFDERLHRADLDKTLTEFAPDVVGVTGFSMHVLAGLRICKRAKELLPNCWTAAGGHHATLMPEDYFEPQMDFVYAGEGVEAFRQTLRALEHGETAPTIPGMWARQNGAFVYGGQPAPFDINALPVPDRSLIPADRPHYFIDWMRPLALARTTVGCPYSCNFCSLWKIMEHIYHLRDIPSLVEELKTIKEEFIFFVDDEAFINGKRMVQLADAIEAAGVKHRYFTYCRMDTMLRQPEVLERWRAIGLERLFIGIEAVTDEDLMAFNKKLAVSQVDQGLKLAKELGISVFANFIVKPSYTKQDFAYLTKFIRDREDLLDYPSFTIWTPIPGTDLLDAEFTGVTERQPNGRPNWALFDCQNPVTKTTLPKHEFMREYQQLWRAFLSHNVEVHSSTRTAGVFGAHARGPQAVLAP